MPILVTNPMLYYTNVMLVLFCAYFIQSHKQQLSQSRGMIILNHKLALTANKLTDHQVYILQNSSLDADQNYATGIV